MEFKVKLSDFQQVIQKVLPALPRKSTVAVLEHIHFSLTGDNLELIANDQEITIQTKIQVDGISDGSILIPGRKLFEIVKALGNQGDLEFVSDDDNFEINMQTTTPFGVYSLRGLNHNEYLDIPELVESAKPNIDNDGNIISTPDKVAMKLDKKAIIRLASKSAFAISTDEFRPAMNGVLFEFRGDYISAVSTDSFRLVKCIVRSDNSEFPNDLDVIFSYRTLEILKKINEDVILSFIEARGKKTHARIDLGDTIFIAKLINEMFPPYETVIPTDHAFRISFNQREIYDAVSRVSILTSEHSFQIKFFFENDQLVISGQDIEAGAHGNETLHCEYQGENFEIAFNSKYLKEALEHLEGETENNIVIMSFSDSRRPVIFKPFVENDDLIMLIMPVKA